MKQLIVNNNGTTIDLFDRTIPSTVTSAKQTMGLGGVDVLNISVKSAEPIPFSIGCTIMAFGRKYTLNRLPKVKKTERRLFQYDLEFEGIQYDLMRVNYDLTIDITNDELQAVQADSLVGDLRRFATILVSNANRVFSQMWALGDCPDTDSDRTLTFGENDNCLSALQKLNSEFNVESEILQNNGRYTINFKEKVGQTFSHTFEFGKGKGLYSLDRQNVDSSNIVTRLKVFGSSANITNKYRANRLCLPNKSKQESYIQKQEAVDKYGIYEATKYFDNIKPTFNGSITGLVDNSILMFVDEKMVDLNELLEDGITTKYRILGLTPKIHFNTGNLAGYEFDIESYDSETNTVTLVPIKDERGDDFPSTTSPAFQFNIGNKYKILDVALPDHEAEAETRLETEANTYYDQNSQPKVQYLLKIAKEYLKLNFVGSGTTGNIFSPGDYINIKDDDINVDKSVRIQSFVRNLLDEYDYDLTISDTVSTNITNRIISELIEQDKIIKYNNLKDPARARANWRSSQELFNMTFDPDGYFTDKIRPQSIETNALSVGAKSMQFGLTNTIFQLGSGVNKNTIQVTEGTLTHYTINENEGNEENEGNQEGIWNLANNTTTFENDNAYYIYAKCEKNGTGGVIIFSDEQIKTESDPDYYHFWIGIVNSVDQNLQARSISLSYGFSMINGRFIKTGRIESSGGSGSFFDLDENQFRIGNTQTGLSWNEGGDGKLILRGTMVQSQAGTDTQPLGFFRGEYNESATYFNGDQVTYLGSTYRYIYPTESTGIYPTNSTYWTISAAKGDPGENGQASDWKTFAYKKSTTNPGSPTGITPIPSGWQDYPDSEAIGNDRWWMAVAMVHWTGSEWQAGSYVGDVFTPGKWSEPVAVTGEQGTDGQFVDFKFAASANMNPPAWNSALASMLNPTGWSDNPPQLPSGGSMWMISAWKQAGGTQLIDNWGTPARISGEKGEKGQDGSSAPLLYLSATAEAITFNANNQPTPSTQTITLEAKLQNISGTATWQAIRYIGSQQSNITLTGSGNTRILTQANFGTQADRVVITASLNGLTDTVTIVKLRDGANGQNGTNGQNGANGQNSIVGYLTNESATLPANSAGTVTNFSGASGIFKVFDGLTDVTSQATFYLVSNTGCTVEIGDTSPTIPSYYDVTSMSSDNATAVFRAVYNGVTIEKTLTLAKSKAGQKGQDGQKGDKGDSPALVFRGEFDPDSTYYGTSSRLDAVKYLESYYVTKTDAGEFLGSNYSPGTGKWSSFGSSLQSIATGLLLAELAYIENLIVGRLSTGKGDNLPRLLADSSEIALYNNKDDEGELGRALIRMGRDVGVMQASGGGRPGIIANDYYGDERYSEFTTAGIFTNGSNVNGISAIPGTNSLMSIAALLQNRASGNSINSAIFGSDDTRDSGTGSEGYGGYFNKTRVGSLFLGTRVVADSNFLQDNHQWLGINDCLVAGYNNSRSGTVLVPANPYDGMILIISSCGNAELRVRNTVSTQRIMTNSILADLYYYSIGSGNTVMLTFFKYGIVGSTGGFWKLNRMSF